MSQEGGYASPTPQALKEFSQKEQKRNSPLNANVHHHHHQNKHEKDERKEVVLNQEKIDEMNKLLATEIEKEKIKVTLFRMG